MEIYKQVRLFRKSLLSIDPEEFRFGLFSQFPKACCEYSSYLLAKFLVEELDHKGIMMLRGENRYKISQRHVWLRLGQMDIDITANQFSSTAKTVFAEAHSEWHKRYRVFEQSIPDTSFNQFHGEPKSDLLYDYKNILSRLKCLNKPKQQGPPAGTR
ncbi:hypothetical protein L1F30_13405 [Simiduia sp. 21SJ11W-1]|uniref:hypothetical protein n=1 Tax=Simiduia sp. 21SJ11W-1 TaxID=2909669 RepID=UPI0020A1D2F1|nr:hypothetical protein [Simiduia sp. 21SJ11W-1]UTA47154.1 hypothetical protein L1F30_13405 [Simiduia sp. 21SJ11W-1]